MRNSATYDTFRRLSATLFLGDAMFLSFCDTSFLYSAVRHAMNADKICHSLHVIKCFQRTRSCVYVHERCSFLRIIIFTIAQSCVQQNLPFKWKMLQWKTAIIYLCVLNGTSESDIKLTFSSFHCCYLLTMCSFPLVHYNISVVWNFKSNLRCIVFHTYSLYLLLLFNKNVFFSDT